MITCDFRTYRDSFFEASFRGYDRKDAWHALNRLALSMLADYFQAGYSAQHRSAAGDPPLFDFLIIHDETLSLFITDSGFLERGEAGFPPGDAFACYYPLKNFAEKAAAGGYDPAKIGDSAMSLAVRIISGLASGKIIDGISSLALFVFTPDRVTESIPPGTFRLGSMHVPVRVFSLAELWEDGMEIPGMKKQTVADRVPAAPASKPSAPVSQPKVSPQVRTSGTKSPGSSTLTVRRPPQNSTDSADRQGLRMPAPAPVARTPAKVPAGPSVMRPDSAFPDYYDSFIDRISVKTEKNPYRSTVASMLTDFYGLSEITKAPDEAGRAKAFDCAFISGDMLCLCILDRGYDNRVEEVITPKDAHEIFQPLLNFVRRASDFRNAAPIVSTAPGVRLETVNIIRELARGHTAPGGIKYLKLYAFTPAAPDKKACSRGFRMPESVFKIQYMECRARVLSLKEMWARGIPIPPAPGSASVQEPHPANNGKSYPGPSPVPPPTPTNDEEEIIEPTDAESFRRKLIADSATGSDFQRTSFFRLCAEILIEADLFEEITPVYINVRDTDAGPIQMDGWSLDEQNNVLTLFALDLEEDQENAVLPKKEADMLFAGLANFVKGSRRKLLYDDDAFDPNTDAGCIADIAQTGLAKGPQADTSFSRVRLIVISSRASAQGTARTKNDIADFSCNKEIIDINELWKLSREDAELKVDFMQIRFGGSPLYVISAVDDKTSGYRSYVGKIPASVLAEIYGEYGQRVLSSNVRAFLSVTQKVNKGIQKTIREEPQKFFAYNNGICAVASAVESNDSHGLVKVLSATDFQVVNGGQTTASLWYAKRAGVSLDKISVPLKLSVVPRDADAGERDNFVQNISKFANSQTQVTASDLGTNTIFQIAFHKLFNNAACTAKSARGLPFGWFYERLRASYKNERSKRESKADKKAFDLRYPKGCLFSKTDLGKWFVSWYGKPHITSLGAQNCYNRFVLDIQQPNEKFDPKMNFVTPEFFKAAVARGIIFLHVDNLIASRKWYQDQRGYKANLTAYTVALLTLAVERNFGPGVTFDLEKIWQNQSQWYDPEHKFSHKEIPVFDEFADRIARGVKAVFDDENRDIYDTGEWVKKENCWLAAQKIRLELGASKDRFLRLYCCRRNPAWDFPKHP